MRVRAELEVLANGPGWNWDHTGTRQSNRYTVRDVATGHEYIFDSFADQDRWRVGSIHRVSFKVNEAGSHIFHPRPVKKI